MRVQDLAIQMTQRILEDLFVAARAMPPEKLEWRPLEMGRSALDQLQECAQALQFAPAMIRNEGSLVLTPEFLEQARQERRTWTALEVCEQHARANALVFYEAVRALPDSSLPQLVELPFGTFRMSEILFGQYWNMLYHYGQINYIQTLYGDYEMH